jgi:competence protein ComEC
MTSRSLGQRAPLLWVLLPLMAGLTSGKLAWLPLSPVWWAAFAVASAVWAVTNKRGASAGLVLAVFLSGAALYEVRRERLPDWDSLPPREVRLTLEIDRRFPPHPDGRSLSGLGRLHSPESHLNDLEGQPVYFSVRLPKGESAPPHPARLPVTGVLQPLPRNAPVDTFDGYLVGQGMNFKLTRAQITGPVTDAGAYQIFCDNALERFNSILGQGVSGQASRIGVLRAMLLGRHDELSDAQKELFRASGTMHLFSISGLHIAVIAAVIHVMLTLVRLPRMVSMVIGCGLLWLYVDITGGTPSAVRAFAMVLFLQASRVLRVPGNPIAALVASAVCVLLLDPMQLFGASFQLSYGIVASLLMLGLPLADHWAHKTALFTLLPKVSWTRWHRIMDWAWRGLLGWTAIGLSTMVVSIVSGVLIFQLFTPVSLPANLVLIPLGSLAIISGFLTLVCGLLGLGWLVTILNHASALLLIAIEKSVSFFAGLPGASMPARFVHDWIGYGAFTGLLGLILFGYASNWENRRGGYWLPFAFTVLILGLCMRPMG